MTWCKIENANTDTRVKWHILSLMDIIYIVLGLTYRGTDRLCGLVVRVPGNRSRCPGSIPGAAIFSEK
jgi:hypothetical protein